MSSLNLPRAVVTGTGSAVPERIVTNDELARSVDTNDEWIVQRTGIRERRVSGPLETSSTLGAEAARRALAAAGTDAEAIDLVVVATTTPDYPWPSAACMVQDAIGAKNAGAFDLSAACAGFAYAMAVGGSMIASEGARKVLVVGADTLTKQLDWTDRATCILFGDGAGAVVLSRGDDADARGLLYSSLHADGGGWEFIYCQPGSRHPIDDKLVAGRNQYIKMRGRDVYKFAVTRFQEMLEDALAKTGLSVEDVALVVPHQVNQRIIDAAMERLKLPPEKAIVNLDRYGNTSAASIPIALDEAVRAGRLNKGDVAVFVAFGAGLTWANAVVRM